MRSANCSGLRAVATTRCPASRTTSVKARPSPRAVPVINQTFDIDNAPVRITDTICCPLEEKLVQRGGAATSTTRHSTCTIRQRVGALVVPDGFALSGQEIFTSLLRSRPEQKSRMVIPPGVRIH